MAEVIWSEAAKLDLEEIALHIWIHGNGRKLADKIVREIYAKSTQYGRQPDMGTRHDDLYESVRIFRDSRYVAAYRIENQGITGTSSCGRSQRLRFTPRRTAVAAEYTCK